LEVVDLAGLAAGLRGGPGFASGRATAVGVAAAGSGAGEGSDATVSGSAAGVPATPIVLDRVRWHVSQVMIVRTSVPS
jgi:hypothetical protein